MNTQCTAAMNPEVELQQLLAAMVQQPQTLNTMGAPMVGNNLLLPSAEEILAVLADQLYQQQLLTAALLTTAGQPLAKAQAPPVDSLLPPQPTPPGRDSSPFPNTQLRKNMFDVRGKVLEDQPRLRKPNEPNKRTTLRGRQSTGVPSCREGSSWRKKGSVQVDAPAPFKRHPSKWDTSDLLDYFRRVYGEGFELKDLFGHLPRFTKDQNGSRFLQKVLPKAEKAEFELAFNELAPDAIPLMNHVFGNYVIQKLIELGSVAQQARLAKSMEGQMLALTKQIYGCRVVQKALDCLDQNTLVNLVKELQGSVFDCTRDLNGNHVIQKCIERLDHEKIDFIFQGVVEKVALLKTHQYGCRVLQRIMERCSNPNYKAQIAAATMENIVELAKNQYGNYVVQHVIEHGTAEQRVEAIRSLTPHTAELSKHKFASNVIEKCLLFGAPEERMTLVGIIFGCGEGSDAAGGKMKKIWHELIIHQFGNYVMQRVLEVVSEEERKILLAKINEHFDSLKGCMYGKHILKRVEKLLNNSDDIIKSALTNRPSTGSETKENTSPAKVIEKADDTPEKLEVEV